MEVGPKLELAQPSSIRSFAAQYQKQKRPLHVLVNNAGANYLSEGVTEDGVPLLTQVHPTIALAKSSCAAVDAVVLFYTLLIKACSMAGDIQTDG